MLRDLGRRVCPTPRALKVGGHPGGARQLRTAGLPLARSRWRCTAEALQTQHSGVSPADAGMEEQNEGGYYFQFHYREYLF